MYTYKIRTSIRIRDLMREEEGRKWSGHYWMDEMR
jgi:hypothetical protein